MNKRQMIVLSAGIIVFGLCIVIGLIFCPFKNPITMTRTQIAEYRQRLRNILGQTTDEKERLNKLEDLAKEVGAGYVNTKIVGSSTIEESMGKATYTYHNTISESEIVLNINNALQTETMIDVCKISARGNWIAVVVGVIAFLSAVAAWVVIYKQRP